MDARILERAMKRQEVLLQAFNKQISWVQAAEILDVSARQIRRIKKAWEDAGNPDLKITVNLNKKLFCQIFDLRSQERVAILRHAKNTTFEGREHLRSKGWFCACDYFFEFAFFGKQFCNQQELR